MDIHKVSIIIPVYNAPEVVTTIRSCLTQTYQPLEIIIVDDGSSVNIKELLNLFNDKRIYYIKNDKHTNANVCRNQGLDLAQGDYVIFLDADDMLMHNHVRENLERLRELQADGIYSSLVWCDGRNCRVYTAGLPDAKETWANYLIRRGLSAQTSTLFLTRESAAATRWDETLTRHQDYDFVARYTGRYHLDIKSNPTVIYNANPFRSKSTKLDDKAFRSCIHFSQTYKSAIHPLIYRNYIVNILKLAKGLRASQEIIEYYENELK